MCTHARINARVLIIFFRRIGVTQFSPTYVRRAFSCMDKPYLKAEFQLHIGHQKGQKTTNTPVASVRIELVYDFSNLIKLRNIYEEVGIEKKRHFRYCNNYKNYRNDTYHVTTFHRTPRISTLVGWTVHNFVSERSRNSGNFKMWTKDSMKFRGSMALNRGRTVYSALQKWLLVKSPLVKVDQFTIPDFNFNTMEN